MAQDAVIASLLRHEGWARVNQMVADALRAKAAHMMSQPSDANVLALFNQIKGAQTLWFELCNSLDSLSGEDTKKLDFAELALD